MFRKIERDLFLVIFLKRICIWRFSEFALPSHQANNRKESTHGTGLLLCSLVAGAEVHGSTIAIYGAAWDRARDYERRRQEAQKRAKLTELRQALLGAWFRVEGESS